MLFLVLKIWPILIRKICDRSGIAAARLERSLKWRGQLSRGDSIWKGLSNWTIGNVLNAWSQYAGEDAGRRRTCGFVAWEGPLYFRVMTSAPETTWNVGCASETGSITSVYRKFCTSGRVMAAYSFSTCCSKASTKPEA